MATKARRIPMAYRKRSGAQGVAVSTDPPPARPCSAPYSPEDLPAEAAPRSPSHQEEEEEEVAVTQHSNQSYPDTQHGGGCHGHSHGGGGHHVDSLDDGDSSSDYVNNSSDEDDDEEEEEDYDEGLPEEDEGVTYYIRYCPEDDSYLEGLPCQGPSHHHPGPPVPTPSPPPQADTDECQEAVEAWVEEGEDEEEEEEEQEEEEELEEEEEIVAEVVVGVVGDALRCEVLQQDDAEDQQMYDGRPEPVLDHLPSHPHPHPPQQQQHQPAGAAGRGGGHVCVVQEGEKRDRMRARRDVGRAYVVSSGGGGGGGGGEYYGAPEDNGNSVSQYRGGGAPPSPAQQVTETGDVGVVSAVTNVGMGTVVEPGAGEETEEDIDQIVAEIKMSMSMCSLSSGSASATDQSPEDLPQDPPCNGPYVPQNEAQGRGGKPPPTTSYPQAPHRHDGRPKSLNIPTARHSHSQQQQQQETGGQRGYKTQQRTQEDRQRWAQEQVTNGAEQPRKQQRSDLNVPLENNNVPEPTKKTSFPSFVDVPGPCEPEDLIDGIIFAANYLGSTQLLSERNPSKNIRMMQAQEAVSRVKRVQKAAKIKKKATPEGDAQTLTEVDLFISTQRIKVLNADTQETMMDNALRTISYIADIGNIVVLMARRRMPRTASQDCIETTPGAPEAKKQYKMICHVFESEDAQLIAQSIGQAFSVAYQEFLRANGINPEDLSQKEYSDIINTQEMYNDDLIHFSNSDNCKELQLEKAKGEILGIVIVESGWGSILPTVILANMMNGGPAARSGKLSIGDQIMSINNTSLVGLPLATCQGIIKALKNQVQVKMNIVSCPPVTTVLIKRPDLKYQLGFSVQNGIICSLMRGGIAERGGVRVGHRIIEINGQSVVATAHEKIVQALSNSVGEIHMKTMPAAMFRLLTGQETPLYI
ncbi:LOW QUALITY PROTEIN: amyloid-beta A4 precursor protein-binding family A member 2 [Engraulis encrasicolus]|uniref:LOW QUALITY PROTEIN: amyloid-beta A4 precursor protein-binding family A member 2 n=1 Tax=Engraulis encrasicolus TaxID=184585 RepID=UPI002FCF2C40